MKNNKKRLTTSFVLPVVVVGAVVIGTIHLGKGLMDEKIGYNVEKESEYRPAGNYSYIIDTNYLESENVNDGLNFSLIVDETSNSSSSVLKSQTSAFYNSNVMVILPDCYSGYSPIVFSKDYFDITYTKTIYQTLQGDCYTVVDASYVAKKYLDIENKNIYDLADEGLMEFQEGDMLTSRTVYYQGQVVAFNQSGAGSDSENVKNALMGEPNLLISDVELEKSVELTLTQLDEIEFNLNQYNPQR